MRTHCGEIWKGAQIRLLGRREAAGLTPDSGYSRRRERERERQGWHRKRAFQGHNFARLKAHHHTRLAVEAQKY